jgi:hypothetical protein
VRSDSARPSRHNSSCRILAFKDWAFWSWQSNSPIATPNFFRKRSKRRYTQVNPRNQVLPASTGRSTGLSTQWVDRLVRGGRNRSVRIRRDSGETRRTSDLNTTWHSFSLSPSSLVPSLTYQPFLSLSLSFSLSPLSLYLPLSPLSLSHSLLTHTACVRFLTHSFRTFHPVTFSNPSPPLFPSISSSFL